MKSNTYYFISVSVFILGIFLYALHHEYIIINPKKSYFTSLAESTTNKQKIMLFFFKNVWQQDEIHLLLSEDKAHNARLIISRWLENAGDEQLINKNISVQDALLVNQNELFISFDRSLFSKESSTFEKWMLIEGILKTIKNTLPSIKKVYFMAQHQPLLDPHLDFTNAWPIEGFTY